VRITEKNTVLGGESEKKPKISEKWKVSLASARKMRYNDNNAKKNESGGTL